MKRERERQEGERARKHARPLATLTWGPLVAMLAAPLHDPHLDGPVWALAMRTGDRLHPPAPDAQLDEPMA